MCAMLVNVALCIVRTNMLLAGTGQWCIIATCVQTQVRGAAYLHSSYMQR